MKVLVTGANGFLGYYLCQKLLSEGHRVIATGRGECRLPINQASTFLFQPLDLTVVDQINAVVRQQSPDYIIHAAAMGKPDECEEKKELATLINTTGTYHLLNVASDKHVPFNYISTDFVFDGVHGNYTEDAERNPVNHYGETKLAAEKLVQQYAADWSIVRTVLVYGLPKTGRSNLLTIVQEKLAANQAYQVVDDQVRTPTFVKDLAKGITAMLAKRVTGVYNICGAEILTPYEMAYQAANYLGLNTQLLIKTNSAAFNQPAKRPLITGLTIKKAQDDLGFSPTSFEEGLIKTFGKP